MEVSDLGEQILALNELSASLLVIIAAILLELVISRVPGIARWRLHTILQAPCQAIERKLNRQKRSDKTRLVRGLLAALVLILPALVLGTIATMGFVSSHPIIAGLGVTIILAFSLRLGLSIALAGALHKAIRAGNRDTANRLIRRYGRGDPAALDDHGLVRMAIQMQCRGWDRGLLAPIFWFLIFGLPGLFILLVIQAADEVVGRADHRLEAFGMVITRLDTILHLPASRLAGLLLIAGLAILRPGKIGAAFAAISQAARADFATNGRWVWGPVAGALDFALAGPVKGEKDRPWIGSGTAKLEPEAIIRSRLPLMTGGILLLLVLVLCFAAALAAGV
ncbi:MAG: hypothetical protein CL558_07190 [Alphaproteobacteria bacterium]|nr:hypothetical protein [Alphaproteobacteria bacterium]MAS47102.1 hypothetical protein [Alphaproteobacteria bacterium]MAX95197.1 hypothetical protein [Alphaproteobacteria bacterium]MBN53349.1 hypothetical protein [Alphaproteobacteria bacterium]OUT41362.1 MAG: hypothetical protein CBB62_03155 [Micavibrio sp. TMED2]|tara:strand:- start:41067 stop:42080 length:1014 start_codon:yes stop_codon:yes gene_type:complete